MLTDVDTEMEVARRHIHKVRWQYAKTMPDWPHEYTVKAWQTNSSAAFEYVCRLILLRGAVEPWPPPPAEAMYHNRYLVSTVTSTGRWDHAATWIHPKR